MTSALVLSSVRKCLGQPKRTILQSIDLTLSPGDRVAILGESGCGKTTLLRLIAGLDCPCFGEIHIAGQLVASTREWIPPERRRIGFVFQDYALFPHLDVSENVAFGLRGVSRGERVRRVKYLLELVGLEPWAHARSQSLSGGQQQRVALARALAPNPEIILLDEAFSALDSVTRERVRWMTREILNEASCTTLLVTHDPVEARFFSERVMRVEQGLLLE